MNGRLGLLFLVCALSWGGLQAAADVSDPVTVSVAREGEQLLFAAEFRVPVGVRTAWAVLTDFEHMPQFLPGLTDMATATPEFECRVHGRQRRLSSSGVAKRP